MSAVNTEDLARALRFKVAMEGIDRDISRARDANLPTELLGLQRATLNHQMMLRHGVYMCGDGSLAAYEEGHPGHGDALARVADWRDSAARFWAQSQIEP